MTSMNEINLDRDQYSGHDIKIQIVDFELVPVTKIHLFPPHEVKIKYYDYKGNELSYGDGGNVAPYMFMVEAEGIDPRLVRDIEFPKLSYADSSKECFVRITTEVYDVHNENESVREKYDLMVKNGERYFRFGKPTGDNMSFLEFCETVDDGCIINSDGSGYLYKNGQEHDVEIFTVLSDLKKYQHIIDMADGVSWYNK